MYFIKGWHLNEFGFPKINNLKKIFMWNKTNSLANLPLSDPVCSYLSATGRLGYESYNMRILANF